MSTWTGVRLRRRRCAGTTEDAFGPIADYGGGHPIVLSHVFETMARVLRHTRRPNGAATLRRLADRVWAAAERGVEDSDRLRLLAGLHARVADAGGTG